MEILLLFLLLQIKHTYADFKIQTYQQTVRKGIYRDLVGISHTLDHVWASLIVLLVYNIWFPIDAFTILVMTILEGIAHYHIDWAKVKWGVKDITKPLFWTQFGLDQLAHQLTYGVMMWYIVFKIN